MGGSRSEWDEPEYFAGTDEFEPDQQWLDDRRIAEHVLQDMDDEAILKASFNQEALRSMLRKPKESSQPKSSSEPVYC